MAALGQSRQAIEHLQRAVALNPAAGLARLALRDQQGLMEGKAPPRDIVPPSVPRRLLESFFGGEPDAPRALAAAGFAPADPIMFKALADCAVGWGLASEAEKRLAEALAASPAFDALRLTYAVALHAQEKFPEAVREVAILRTRSSGFDVLRLDAALKAQTGDYEAALELYDRLLDLMPGEPDLTLARGHVLKTLGRQAEALTAYRQNAAGLSGAGAGYWAIANLKVVAFDEVDLQRMHELIADPRTNPSERVDLHFALGKALEDAGDFAAAFSHYEAGNTLRRGRHPFDPAAHSAFVDATVATMTEAFFSARADAGTRQAGPIFIVGLPRSGSTLVEQILACHSQVEGTAELPDVRILAAQAHARSSACEEGYPASLAGLPADAFTSIGEGYLNRTSLHRRLGRLLFTDKFPGNVLHAGFIHLILPEARIIDVRRDPMACALSAFRQNFAGGQAYSADLGWFASYYRDYERLTAHFDTVLPGRIHRIAYEDLVTRPELEIRRLLAYCGLPFEDACLRPHEANRPVRTASSEQVRRPLDGGGLEDWRRFEPWLAPLRDALDRC
ncbi:tetratricopeptide repeat-containing sulfotransferase family protein [Phenylobacterium sp.]|uniref:tetratricopeptide repeat-containing sulfotransferase family protein n=1 Tax=Phenylobacterium sp. TaxID=1871053 RepID=UPI0025EFAC7A|nr:tetratricopeptide repeat-containing sulfotransferase family protein [Phenylobacterium sp.]